MSESESNLQFVGYRRERNPLAYGSIQRLQALGRFFNEYADKFVVSLLALLFVEVGAEFLLTSRSVVPLFVLPVALIVVYRAVSLIVRLLATGLGQPSWFGTLAGFLLPSFTLVLFVLARSTPIPFVTPIAVLLICGLISLCLAKRELRRYGVSVGSLALRCPSERIATALADRRQWDQNPLPPIPANLYSGEVSSG